LWLCSRLAIDYPGRMINVVCARMAAIRCAR